MEIKFRPLKAEEIECRIQQLKEGRGKNEGNVYAICLLYKDARCDQKILDETVTPMGWQRRHYEHNGNLFCAIGIKDTDTGGWVWKEDAGEESNMSAQKGHASDAFKRAGTNWGIGRELYTKLFIFFQLSDDEYYIDKGKPKANPRAKFHVGDVAIQDGEIKHIKIIDSDGKVRWAK